MKKEDKITAEKIEKRKIAYKIVESNLSHKAGTNALSIEEAVNAVVSGMEHVSLLPMQEQSKQEVKLPDEHEMIGRSRFAETTKQEQEANLRGQMWMKDQILFSLEESLPQEQKDKASSIQSGKVTEENIRDIYDAFSNWYLDDGSYDDFHKSECIKIISSLSPPEVKGTVSDEELFDIGIKHLGDIKYEPLETAYFLKKDDCDMGEEDFCHNCIDEQMRLRQIDFPKHKITYEGHDPDFSGGRNEPATCSECGEPFITEFTPNIEEAIHLFRAIMVGDLSDRNKWELEIALRNGKYADLKTKRILAISVRSLLSSKAEHKPEAGKSEEIEDKIIEVVNKYRGWQMRDAYNPLIDDLTTFFSTPSERKAVEQIEPDGWVTENKKFVSRQDYLERPDFYNLKTAKPIYFFPPIQEAEHKQGVKMLTYSEVEELADEHLKIASISKHEGHCEQWIEGFYNFYESLLSLPLKEEQKRLTDKDLLNLMGRFYFQLEKAKGDEVQQVYKVYATQFRSLLGEQRKEGKDEV